MAKRRFYRRPPLIEALCQFSFTPSREWDDTVPGLLYSRIREQYPVRKSKKPLGLLVNPETGEIKRDTGTRTQFFDEARTRLIQVGADLLVVNRLRPYLGWEDFRNSILSAVAHYREVAEPLAAQSLVLRYINKLVLPDEPVVRHREYILFSPELPEGLPDQFSGWTQSVDVVLGEHDVLRITSGSAVDENRLAFVLDLEVTWQTQVDLDNLQEVLDNAHMNIEQAFELLLTDNSRSLFEEIPDEQTSVG